MKYLHIHLFMFLTILVGLFIDGVMMSTIIPQSQWIANVLVVAAFFWVYQHASKQVKQLMGYGLVVAVGGRSLVLIGVGYVHLSARKPSPLCAFWTLTYLCRGLLPSQRTVV